MEDQWYILVADRKKAGPVTFEKLLDLKNKGKIAPNTMVRKVTEKKWIAAAMVPELFGGILSESKGEIPIVDFPEDIGDVSADSAMGNASETVFIQAGASEFSEEGLEETPESEEQEEKEQFPAFSIQVTPRSKSSKKPKDKKSETPESVPEPVAPVTPIVGVSPSASSGSIPVTPIGKSARSTSSPASTSTKSSSKYPALVTIAFLLKIFAVIHLIFGVLGALGTVGMALAGGSQFEEGSSMLIPGILAGGMVLIGAIVGALLLWGISELIRLMIDIEENTRK